MIKRITSHKDLLKAILSLKPKFREALLENCGDDEINCITECIFNVLKGKVPLKDKERRKLKKHKDTLRQIISKGESKVRKQIILQKGGAFLPIIIGSVLSALLGSIINK